MQSITSITAAQLRLLNRPPGAGELLELAEYGFSLRATDRKEMLKWCELAASHLSQATAIGESTLVRAHYGNALRVNLQVERARAVALVALELAEPNPDPFILEALGSIYYSLRDFDSAYSVLARASVLRQQPPHREHLLRTLLQTAIVLDQAGRSTEAVDYAARVLAVAPDYGILRVAVQNIGLFLTNSGQPSTALRLLKHTQDLVRQGGKVHEHQLDWLLAKIANAQRRYNDAIELFETAGRGFEAADAPQLAALVRLELAYVHLYHGDYPAAREALIGVRPFLTAIGLKRDSSASRLLEIAVSSSISAEACRDVVKALVASVDGCTSAGTCETLLSSLAPR